MIRQMKKNQMTTSQTMRMGPQVEVLLQSPQVEALLQRYLMMLGSPSPKFQVLSELPNPEPQVLNQAQNIGLSALTIKGHSVGKA